MIEVNHVLAFTLLLTVAIMLHVRELRRQVPVFFSYVVYATFGVGMTYLLYHFADPYVSYYSIWVDDLIGILFEFAIIVEIFNRLFAPYESIRRFARLVVSWVAVILIVLGALSAVIFRDASYTVPVLTAFLVLDRTLRAIQLGLLISLFALSKYLHLRWRNLTFGIALGFGFYALLILTGAIVRMYYGKLVGGNVNALFGVAYCAAILIWISYVLQPEAARIPIVSLPSHELER